MKTITLLSQLRKFRNDSKLTAQKVQELSRQRFSEKTSSKHIRNIIASNQFL